MSKYWFVLGLLLSLAACAPQAPRYQFTPPSSAEGLTCIQRCDRQAQQCKQSCAASQASCRQRAEQQARRELPARLEAWDIAIAAWERAVRRYERDLRFYEIDRYHRRIQRDLVRQACDDGKCRSSYPFRGGLWSSRPLSPGPAPRRPTLETETARIQAASCPKDCGCDAEFRQCYIGCGGQIRQY